MALSARSLTWLGLLTASAAAAVAADAPVRRAGDADPYVRFREFFFHEARPDPLHQKFEELFKQPYPEEGFHQGKPYRPFEDVQKFNDAFELRGVSGARTELRDRGATILLSVEVPGSAGKPVDFRANEERVFLTVLPSEPPRKYRIARTQDLVLPLPEGADWSGPRVTREGDWIRVEFEKEKPKPRPGRRDDAASREDATGGSAMESYSFLSDVKSLRDRARRHIEEGAVTPGYKADRSTVVKLLNTALATETVCVLRYKRHQAMARGIHAQAVADEFGEHAAEEQQHADRIAERIVQLGGEPDFSPDRLAGNSHTEYKEGGDLLDMIQEDLIAERVAIDSYGEIIRYLGDNDPTTRKLMEDILAKEEEHADDLASLLADLGAKVTLDDEARAAGRPQEKPRPN